MAAAGLDPSVEALLGRLVPDLAAALGADIVGLYLYGSALEGGFIPGVSDVDLVAVTARPADALPLADLERMHRDVVRALPEWDDRVEVVYVRQAALAEFRTSAERLAVVSPGEPFHVRDERISEWLQNWWYVRERSRTLVGPPPAELVPLIAWSEFADATRRYAHQLASKDPSKATPGALAYVVLTACRASETLRLGRPIGKLAAAEAVSRARPEFADPIREAIAARWSRGAAGLREPGIRARAAELVRALVDDRPYSGEA